MNPSGERTSLMHGRHTFEPALVLSHPAPQLGSYVSRWAESLRARGIDVDELGVRRLVGRRHAIVHIHWPEHLVRPGPPLVVLFRLVRTAALLLLLFAQRNPVVWTAHNLAPHSGWRFVDRLVAAPLHRLLDGVVVTTAAHEKLVIDEFSQLEAKRFVQIPLVGLEPGSAGKRPRTRRAGPVRLVQFGSIAPYRGQLLVVEALQTEIRSGRCELVIVGRCPDEAYLRRLEAIASTLPGLTLRPEHVSDADLRALMLEADAAIGIQVDGLNTGVLPAALPLGVPVISAATPQAEEIQLRFGEQWVHLLDDLENRPMWRAAVEWAVPEREPPADGIFGAEENGRLHVRFYNELSGAR